MATAFRQHDVASGDAALALAGDLSPFGRGDKTRNPNTNSMVWFRMSRSSVVGAAYSVIDFRTHFSITSAIWSEFFSSIIMWPLP
jgi:hypothetical protein